MRNIQVEILNPFVLKSTRDMAVLGARVTQNSKNIHGTDDFCKLYDAPYSEQFIENIMNLPHPTLQKFTKINIIVIGASRRVLAQLTRHQYGVHFMSGSLQYGDFSDTADVVIPQGLSKEDEQEYLKLHEQSAALYKKFAKIYGTDIAGYTTLNGMRNVLLISAEPFELKHMIRQRICRRNTSETRLVMLKIWQALYEFDPIMFSIETTGTECQCSNCKEGKFCCGSPLPAGATPYDIIAMDFGGTYADNN